MADSSARDMLSGHWFPPHVTSSTRIRHGTPLLNVIADTELARLPKRVVCVFVLEIAT